MCLLAAAVGDQARLRLGSGPRVCEGQRGGACSESGVSAVKARGAAAGPSAPKEEQGEIAGQGQQQMTQEELNYALYMACGSNNDQARAEELLGRGADPNALA